MSNQKRPYRIIISGGGTGGHIYPALAIAKALQQIDPKTKILFVGAEGRMEMKKVPEAGYEIIGLWISGIQRSLTLQNLAFPLKLISSLIASNRIINEFKPQVVVGVGGFASGPLLYTAALKKIPSLIQEQNSYAGLTNKLLAKKAHKVCVAHPGMEKYFPAAKIVMTGNPVRDDIKEIGSVFMQAIEYFQLSRGRKTILVMGGSLGARTINESVFHRLQDIINSGVQLIWQTGELYFKEFEKRVKGYDLTNVRIMKFLEEMALAYSIASVVVSRAGALSISELCIVGKPVIFIPSPNVAEDHQTSNANTLVDQEAALMIPDSEAQDRLVQEALELINNTDKQERLSNNIGKMARPDAARDIAREVLKLIK